MQHLAPPSTAYYFFFLLLQVVLKQGQEHFLQALSVVSQAFPLAILNPQSANQEYNHQFWSFSALKSQKSQIRSLISLKKPLKESGLLSTCNIRLVMKSNRKEQQNSMYERHIPVLATVIPRNIKLKMQNTFLKFPQSQ